MWNRSGFGCCLNRTTESARFFDNSRFWPNLEWMRKKWKWYCCARKQGTANGPLRTARKAGWYCSPIELLVVWQSQDSLPPRIFWQETLRCESHQNARARLGLKETLFVLSDTVPARCGTRSGQLTWYCAFLNFSIWNRFCQSTSLRGLPSRTIKELQMHRFYFETF